MTERTYTQADLDSAVAAALEEAADVASKQWVMTHDATDMMSSRRLSESEVAAKIRSLRPDATRIPRDRDARVYAEALEAAAVIMDTHASWHSANCYDDGRVEYESHARDIRALPNPYEGEE